MKVLINDVEIGAYDDYSDIIHDFWIIGELLNKFKIRIYDGYCYDLRQYKDHFVECLIDIEIIRSLHIQERITKKLTGRESISGKFLKNYKLFSEWINLNKNLTNSNYDALETETGIFLLNPSEYKNLELKDGDWITIDVIRYDLLAWHPIE